MELSRNLVITGPWTVWHACILNREEATSVTVNKLCLPLLSFAQGEGAKINRMLKVLENVYGKLQDLKGEYRKHLKKIRMVS